jgi:Predicted oxidoreductase related to nitroreductase
MNYSEAIENRRSHYSLIAESPLSDEELQQLIGHSVKHAPSAFNSQSSRVVLLKGAEHKKLWDIVLASLREIVPAEAFAATEEKIRSFAAAYGSVLFFEDQDTVKGLQAKFPAYADNFPTWSQQHSGMLQLMIWTALEEAGLGVSLQHYNPLIDDQVRSEWGLPANWKLIAQMPFGRSVSEPGPKEYMPMTERLYVFG